VSNRRKHDSRYQKGYLQSPAWRETRHKWWVEEKGTAGGKVRCWVCRGVLQERVSDMHHLEYRGKLTENRNGIWESHEQHEDIVAVHKKCHSELHRLIDHDLVLNKNRGRRVASEIARQKIQKIIIKSLQNKIDTGMQAKGEAA